MSLYIAHFLMKEENASLSTQPPYDVNRREKRHFIASHLFAASDAEAAYDRAIGMLPGLSDANHDGPGDRTNVEPVGIFDLDEVFVAEGQVVTGLSQPYGIDVGILFIEELLCQRTRTKQELTVFAGPRDGRAEQL
ncbi:hypothetical protein BO996_14595 [Delftia sp. HK171]|nr:hypothetical protein BO996_14595 [Delftia sp. HK171]